MDAETKREISELKNQIGTLRVFYLVTVILFLYAFISFQIQYTNIRSYYMATVSDCQELNLLLKE